MRKKEITNEELARMIARGFENVDKRFESVATKDNIKRLDGRMDRLELNVNQIDARLSRIESDVGEIRNNFVYRHEFEDLMARVKYMET